MEKRAILHRGRPLDCFPTSESSMYLRLRAARGDLDEAVVVFSDNKFEWTTKPRIEQRMELLRSDELYDYFGTELALEDTRLAYVFRLSSGGERFYLCEEGVSRDFVWDLGYFNYFQYPYIHKSDVMRVPEWTRGAVCCQIFPERFRIGSAEKDRSYINLAWGERPSPKSFAGGDLRGIEEGLDYLAETGVSCIYMTPVFLSPSNHKYDIEDYYRVDPRFGGDEALRSLITSAHERGMRVVLDGVFNHCANTNPIFLDTSVRGRESAYWDWFFIDGERSSFAERNYKTFADVPYMPKLNTDNDAVIDYFCGVGAWWIREFGIDGWRLDVMDEISDDFLRAFRKAVKAANPDALILGEAWHDPRAWLAGDELDGVMNYGLTKALIDYLVDGALTARQAASRLTRLFFRTTSISARMMMNLLDSHDTDRFLTLLRGDRQRLKLALCLLFFFPGMPCVYYGDEIGMTGGYDPDCRKGFIWDETAWDAELRRHVQLLARLKTGGRLAGDVIRISASDDVLTLEREELTLLINASSRAARYCFRGREGQIAANGFVILDADASIIKEE